MIDPLFEFQKGMIRFCRDNPRCILGADTGLGKTRVCIETSYKEGCSRVLAIVPAIVRINWCREVEKWCKGNWKVFAAYFAEDIIKGENQFVVISYKFLLNQANFNAIRLSRWDMIICDEAHDYLRNWEVRTTKTVILDICRHRKRLIFSTATPVVKSASDMHPMLSVVEPGRWGRFGDFCQTYALPRPDPFSPRKEKVKYVLLNPRKSDELKSKMSRCFLSILKKDVQQDLPKCIETDILLETGIDFESDVTDSDISETDTPMSTDRLTLGLKKVKPFFDWLDSSNFGEEQIVIFAWHQKVIAKITNRFRSTGESYDSLLGGEVDDRRQFKIDQFQKGHTRYLVCSIAATGVGINLTAASIAIFLEFPWNFSQYKQCLDRIVRTGQKNTVNAYRFIGLGTLDEHILNTLNKKEQMTDELSRRNN